MAVHVSDEERASWTVTAKDDTKGASEVTASSCLCSEILIPNKAMATKEGHQLDSIIMTLIDENTGEEITAYFNHTRAKSGTVTVQPESRFARLHRLTTGKYKRNDYSRAKCLFRSLIGLCYVVIYSQDKTKFGILYFKASTVMPVDPITSELWNEQGRLLLKKITSREPLIAVKNKQNLCNKPVKHLQSVCKTSVIEKAEEAHSYLDSPPISTALQHNNITNLQHNHITAASSNSIAVEVMDSHNVRYQTIMKQVSSTERSYQYYQRPDESDDDYLGRIIDESLHSLIH